MKANDGAVYGMPSERDLNTIPHCLKWYY